MCARRCLAHSYADNNTLRSSTMKKFALVVLILGITAIGLHAQTPAPTAPTAISWQVTYTGCPANAAAAVATQWPVTTAYPAAEAALVAADQLLFAADLAAFIAANPHTAISFTAGRNLKNGQGNGYPSVYTGVIGNKRFIGC